MRICEKEMWGEHRRQQFYGKSKIWPWLDYFTSPNWGASEKCWNVVEMEQLVTTRQSRRDIDGGTIFRISLDSGRKGVQQDNLIGGEATCDYFINCITRRLINHHRIESFLNTNSQNVSLYLSKSRHRVWRMTTDDLQHASGRLFNSLDRNAKIWQMVQNCKNCLTASGYQFNMLYQNVFSNWPSIFNDSSLGLGHETIDEVFHPHLKHIIDVLAILTTFTSLQYWY